MAHEINGFVIYMPGLFGERDVYDHNTFAPTAAEAWRRLFGHDNPNFSALVQKWHDRGARVVRAEMICEPPCY